MTQDTPSRLPAAWRKRLALTAFLGCLLLLVLAARLFQLQVVYGESYERRAVVNMVRSEKVPTMRGKIFDARGRVLATNEARFYVSAVPAEIHSIPLTTATLAAALDVDPELLRNAVRRHSGNPLEEFVLLDNLDSRQFARVAEVQPDLPGIYLRARSLRRYPFGLSASHVLGHVGQISSEEVKDIADYREGDIIGKTGLEKQFDTELRGQKGTRYLSMDAAGRTLQSRDGTPSRPGLDLFLTLDMRLQQRAEEVLQDTLESLEASNHERSGGAILVLGANTGEVLAMASLPAFDPNLFARGISSKEYQKLLGDPAFPLLDRACRGAYPPGSTFKLVTASTSLQEKLCNRYSQFKCTGRYEVADQVFHCFVRTGHGTIDFVNSIGQSCDVVFYSLGAALGINRLQHYAMEFGLGQPTGVDLPEEESGLLPDPGWKKQNLHEPWYDGDTVNMAIGQGYLAATPLQMGLVTAAVANGGKLYRPYLVRLVKSWDHKVVRGVGPKVRHALPVDPSYLEAVRLGMAAAVNSGTARLAQSSAVTIAGKTGTVENYATSDNPHGRNHAWFVGFAPVQNPEIVIVVFLEKSGGLGGKLAAPIAREVIEAYWQEVRRAGKPTE